MDDLVARLKRKDREAFGEVMRMFKKPIYNYLILLVGNSETAEELAQDTFVKVYFKAHTLKADDLKTCKSWIYKIASNLAMSEFRKRKIKNIISFSHWQEQKDSELAYHPTVEGQIIVEDLIANVPEKYRMPLIMKEIENIPFDEIARMLNKPVGTVKSLVFRGKQYLRNLVQPDQGEENV